MVKNTVHIRNFPQAVYRWNIRTIPKFKFPAQSVDSPGKPLKTGGRRGQPGERRVMLVINSPPNLRWNLNAPALLIFWYRPADFDRDRGQHLEETPWSRHGQAQHTTWRRLATNVEPFDLLQTEKRETTTENGKRMKATTRKYWLNARTPGGTRPLAFKWCGFSKKSASEQGAGDCN